MTVNQRLVTLFPKSSFVRSASMLVGGTALAQGITILASPILTRLYTPDDFGVLAVYAAVLGLASVMAGLSYELAIPLPRTDRADANVLALACLCVVLVAASVVLAITLFGKQLVIWTNTQVLAPYLWLLPIGVVFSGFYQCFNYWAIRKKAFGRIARTRFQQSVSSVTTQVGLGWVHFGPLGLIIGQIIGQSAGIIELIRRAVVEDWKALKRIRVSRIRVLAFRYRKFPQYSTLEGFANVSSTQLPLILLAVFFLPADVGLFLLALRVLQAPLGLIGNAAGQVFFSRAAQAKRDGRLNELTLKVFQGLVRLGVGPLIFVAIIAPNLFAFVFGENWRTAGEYARWMVPWLIAQFVFSPISTLTTVGERQFGGFKSQLLFLITRNSFLLIGILSGSVYSAISLYSISGFIVYSLYGSWIMRISGNRFIDWFSLLVSDAPIILGIVLSLYILPNYILPLLLKV